MGNCFTLVYVLNQVSGSIDKTSEEFSLFLNESDSFLEGFLGELEIEVPNYLVDRVIEKASNS
jgi:hypothetical protein